MTIILKIWFYEFYRSENANFDLIDFYRAVQKPHATLWFAEVIG